MSCPKAFVLGWPVAHSRSPLIHGFWLRRYGIDGEYRPEAVRPEDVQAFLQSIQQNRLAGGNVTIPHKEAAFQACRERTATAQDIGAVNTLWLRDGRLCGDNTDAYGFSANLDEYAPAWRQGRSALVLGAGGAARAVVYAVLAAGFDRVWVLNRTVERAAALVHDLGAQARAGSFDLLPDLLPTADLVVNTVPGAGVAAGQGGLAVDWSVARSSAIATDIVYVPLLTPFLAGASRRGLKVVDGIGMLLHQAVPGFERWFGRRPEVDAELRSLVVADLESR